MDIACGDDEHDGHIFDNAIDQCCHSLLHAAAPEICIVGPISRVLKSWCPCSIWVDGMRARVLHPIAVCARTIGTSLAQIATTSRARASRGLTGDCRARVVASQGPIIGIKRFILACHRETIIIRVAWMPAELTARTSPHGVQLDKVELLAVGVLPFDAVRGRSGPSDIQRGSCSNILIPTIEVDVFAAPVVEDHLVYI